MVGEGGAVFRGSMGGGWGLSGEGMGRGEEMVGGGRCLVYIF